MHSVIQCDFITLLHTRLHRPPGAIFEWFCNFPYLSTCLWCMENCQTIQKLHLVVCGSVRLKKLPVPKGHSKNQNSEISYQYKLASKKPPQEPKSDQKVIFGYSAFCFLSSFFRSNSHLGIRRPNAVF